MGHPYHISLCVRAQIKSKSCSSHKSPIIICNNICLPAYFVHNLHSLLYCAVDVQQGLCKLCMQSCDILGRKLILPFLELGAFYNLLHCQIILNISYKYFPLWCVGKTGFVIDESLILSIQSKTLFTFACLLCS